MCPCLVPRPHFFSQPKHFRSRGPFASDTLPKRIDQEGPGKRRTGTKQNVSQIKLEFGSVGFWGEQKTGVPGEKPLEARTKTNNKLYPHAINAKTWTRVIHWWEATVPPLTAWVPNLNINTLIAYTFHYQFFLILVALFSLFLLTLMTCTFDQARIIQEEMKCTQRLLQYITHLV